MFIMIMFRFIWKKACGSYPHSNVTFCYSGKHSGTCYSSQSQIFTRNKGNDIILKGKTIIDILLLGCWTRFSFTLIK